MRAAVPAFCFVLTSSGFGKTQLAFSIFELPVIYLTCPYGGARNQQNIYDYFWSLSALMKKCVSLDITKLLVKGGDQIKHKERLALFSTSKLIEHLENNEEFFTLRFFDWLFCQIKGKCGVLDPRELTSSRIIKPISVGCFTPNRESIVFLDEFYGLSDEDNYSLAFLRNILRLLKIRTTVMGTNTSAYNLFTNSSRFSGSDDRPPWVYIWSSLPAYSSVKFGMIDSLLHTSKISYPQQSLFFTVLRDVFASE